MESNGQKPFDYVIPRIIALLSSPNERLRIESLTICNQFIMPPTPPNALALNADAFLTQVFKLASDTHSEVRKLVCQAFNTLLASWAEKLLPNLKSIIDFMLFSTQDSDDGVALQAAEFWLTFVEEPDLPEHLQPYLSQVLPVLLKGMIYSEYDQAVMDQDDEQDNKPDKESDIRPKHYGKSGHGHEKAEGVTANGTASGSVSIGKTAATNAVEEEEDEEEEEEEGDDDDDPYAEWTVRKCCAAAVDMMATQYGPDILPIILPFLKTELENPEWKHREAGILALGAIAEGCVDGIEPHLPALVPFLFESLKHEKVRSAPPAYSASSEELFTTAAGPLHSVLDARTICLMVYSRRAGRSCGAQDELLRAYSIWSESWPSLACTLFDMRCSSWLQHAIATSGYKKQAAALLRRSKRLLVLSLCHTCRRSCQSSSALSTAISKRISSFCTMRLAHSPMLSARLSTRQNSSTSSCLL